MVEYFIERIWPYTKPNFYSHTLSWLDGTLGHRQPFGPCMDTPVRILQSNCSRHQLSASLAFSNDLNLE